MKDGSAGKCFVAPLDGHQFRARNDTDTSPESRIKSKPPSLISHFFVDGWSIEKYGFLHNQFDQKRARLGSRYVEYSR